MGRRSSASELTHLLNHIFLETASEVVIQAAPVSRHWYKERCEMVPAYQCVGRPVGPEVASYWDESSAKTLGASGDPHPVQVDGLST